METAKRLWRYVLFCGLTGGFLSSYLAPKVIAWYFDPPVNIGVNCRAATEWSMNKLQIAQGVGSLVGGVLGLILFLVLKSKGSKPRNVPGEPTSL